jgi:hypothetical protein
MTSMLPSRTQTWALRSPLEERRAVARHGRYASFCHPQPRLDGLAVTEGSLFVIERQADAFGALCGEGIRIARSLSAWAGGGEMIAKRPNALSTASNCKHTIALNRQEG